MLVKDIMTKNVVTIPTNASIGEAKKIMKEHKFRRLPVVDGGKLAGIVTEDRLEHVSPKTAAPLLWQISYLIAHTTVGDIMRKDVVTIKPEATIEQAITLSQSSKIGALVVVKGSKIVGICTTNDFFYKLLNPTLGLGESGIRILVSADSIGRSAQRIISCINRLGIEIKVLWAVASPTTNKKNIVIHLATEDATDVIKELGKLGCTASIVAR